MANFMKVEHIEFCPGENVKDCIETLIRYAKKRPANTTVKTNLNGYELESSSFDRKDTEKEIQHEIKQNIDCFNAYIDKR